MHSAIAGYSVAFWVNFPSLPNQEHVYLSSGGDLQDNHGLAMSLNQYGQLTFTFKTKEGLVRKFVSESNLIVPSRWYHILATFSQTNGVRLYINGLRVGALRLCSIYIFFTRISFLFCERIAYTSLHNLL